MTDESVHRLKANKLSLAVQTQQYLLDLIEGGTYHPGEQLPSEADLAAQLGISRPTLREALQNLEQEEIIIRKHGVGCEALQVRQALADEELAAKLQVAPNTWLTSVQRTIMVDGKPVAYMLDLIPASVLLPADVDGTFNGSVLDLLKQKQDLHIAQAPADIVALNADTSVAEKLEVEVGHAVLLLEELLYNIEGTPVEFSQNYFMPEYFRFRVVRR
jgi:GntR family transcriptional regulator